MFLVVFCIITYLEPQIRKFLKKDKTFATTITEIEQVEMPAMVICANPEFKTSTRWNYDHSEEYCATCCFHLFQLSVVFPTFTYTNNNYH